jgi:S-ribosylhomocysteine lyase
LEKITSFTIDHNKLDVGVYISRVDGDITTYDLRTRRPYIDGLMDNSTMHSVEHMFATYIRNSELRNSIIYFGPMGCQTGFYLLVRDAAHQQVLETIKTVLLQIINHTGDVFGNSETECGNHKSLAIDKAKKECSAYYQKISEITSVDLNYPG